MQLSPFIKPDVKLKSGEHINFFKCSQCGLNKANVSTISTGYARDRNDNKICFSCCGINDAKELINLKQGEKAIQYWDGKNIINWPSSLKIKPYYVTKGKHNIARTREDIYFNFEGFRFHATQYGDNSQIAHIKKMKA